MLLRLTIGLSMLLAAAAMLVFLLAGETAWLLTVGILAASIGWLGLILLDRQAAGAGSNPPLGASGSAWEVALKWVGAISAFLAVLSRVVGE